MAIVVLGIVWSTHGDFMWPMAILFTGIFVQEGFRRLERARWPVLATHVCLHERFVTLGPKAGIDSARRLAVLAPRQRVIPVVNERWCVVGLLDMRTLSSFRDQESVAEIMLSPVSLTQPLDARGAMELMRSVGLNAIPFVDHRGRIIALASVPSETPNAPVTGRSTESAPVRSREDVDCRSA